MKSIEDSYKALYEQNSKEDNTEVDVTEWRQEIKPKKEFKKMNREEKIKNRINYVKRELNFIESMLLNSEEINTDSEMFTSVEVFDFINQCERILNNVESNKENFQSGGILEEVLILSSKVFIYRKKLNKMIMEKRQDKYNNIPSNKRDNFAYMFYDTDTKTHKYNFKGLQLISNNGTTTLWTFDELEPYYYW